MDKQTRTSIILFFCSALFYILFAYAALSTIGWVVIIGAIAFGVIVSAYLSIELQRRMVEER